MLTALYTNYFQKSRLFLYPLLDIKRGAPAVPLNTYVAWEGKHNSEDIKYICTYENRIDAPFTKFENTKLLNHNRLLEKHELPEQITYIFDFSDMKQDWLCFLDGKYSQISDKNKRKILNFFDKYTSNHVYMDSYLFPGKYFKLYAELLGVDEQLLRDVGELCNKPDINKETLNLFIPQKKTILI
jgi:hypothetical protein